MSSIKQAKETVPKRPDEEKLIDMSFAGDMITGEIIAAVISYGISPSGQVQILAVTYSGQTVQFRVNGGVANTTYTLHATILTSKNQRFYGEGLLRVDQ